MFAPQASSCFVMSSSSAAGMSGLSNDVLELGRGDERLVEERRAAAREQKEHGVVGGEVFDELYRGVCRDEGVFVGDWVARLDDARVRELALRVPVLRDYEPFVYFVAEYRACGARHLPRRLAYGDHDKPAGAELASLERLCDRRVGQRRAQRFGYDFIRVFSDSAHCEKSFSLRKIRVSGINFHQNYKIKKAARSGRPDVIFAYFV